MTLTVTDLKAHCNVTSDDDDAVLTRLLAAASAHVERLLGFKLTDTTALPDGPPADLELAVLMLAADWFENREASLVGVSAQEFNSVNEGARPILMAVAAGLDAAGGSVSKLKTLVNEGKLSGKQFFEAFIKGLPQIEGMAANSTETISQGWTKVTNALTKYIGETDESMSASQRLVGGLNTLADNFGASSASKPCRTA